jgi:hypothetical protein
VASIIRLAPSTILLFTILLSAPQSRSDSAWAATPIVIASYHGDFYLKLVPTSPDQEGGGTAAMFKVSSPEDKLLYEIQGWYSRKVLLWLNPEYIVRVGNDPSWLQHPPERHVAIAFYHNGALTKRYLVSELVPESSDLPRSTSHYQFFKSVDTCRAPGGATVRVETTAEKEIYFNFNTGERVSGKESTCPWWSS